MIKSLQSIQEKESIVAEYLLGNHTYRQLGKKHNIDFRIIHSWVMKFKGKSKPPSPTENPSLPESGSQKSIEVLHLEEALRKEKLRNELLNAIIDIAEKELKISIRKKSGTRQ